MDIWPLAPNLTILPEPKLGQTTAAETEIGRTTKPRDQTIVEITTEQWINFLLIFLKFGIFILKIKR